MKKMILLLIILALTLGLGLMAFKYPGYMLLAMGPWRIESTLWFGLLCILLVILAVQITWRLIRATGRLGQRWTQWSTQRKCRKSHELSRQGLCDLAEGRLADAEKKLLKAALYSETPLMNYCQAAKAAQQQQAFERRDQHLQLAQDTLPEAHLAIGLNQAALQYETGSYQNALGTLQKLAQKTPKHPQILRQMLQCHQQLQDVDAVNQMLSTLRQEKCLSKQALAELDAQIQPQLLQEVVLHGDPTAVHTQWKKLPKKTQQKTDNTLLYCDFLINHGDHGEAEKILSRQLNKQWDSKLLRCYGQLSAPSANKALQQAQPWLEQHPNHADLLQCLGQLATSLQLWGKAKDYLKQSLQLTPTAEKHFALAALYQQSKDTAQVQQHISAGLGLWQQHGHDQN
jgi:HemY protein